MQVLLQVIDMRITRGKSGDLLLQVASIFSCSCCCCFFNSSYMQGMQP
jgi:hypothetical protein